VSRRRWFRASRVAGVAALFACAVAAAFAQGGPVVRAFVRPAGDVTQDQTVRFVIQVDGGNSAEIPQLSNLTNLRVIAGPERRSSTSWTNGRMSASYEVSYTLVPDGPGPAVIPAFSVQVGDRVHRTEAIRFDVKDAVQGAPAQAGTAARPRPDGSSAADVFLRADLGAQDVWVGEAVPLSVSLFSAESVSSPSWVHLPSFSSFWVEDLEVDADAESYETRVEGRPYRVYPLLRKILVPQTAGAFEIEPYELQMQVTESDRRSRFGGFPFGRSSRIVRNSQPVTLHARSLPRNGRPDEFSGAVGAYTMKVELDRSDAAVNEAIGLTAVVEGEGFMKSASAPVLRVGPDFKVFDPEVEESFRVSRGRMVSRKTWQWVLVPLAPGEIRAPELSFAWFDPTRERYDSARWTPPLLMVRRGDSDARVPRQGEEIRVQRRDLAFIKPLRGSLGTGSARVHEQRLFLVALAAPLAWAPIVIVAGRRRARFRRDRGRVRASRARPVAKKRLDAAGRNLEATDASFHEDVARALVEYVADRFDRSAAGMTYDAADELLSSRGVEHELRVRFRGCLETCDFARFVPASGSTERRTEVLHDARALIDGLEKAL